MAVEYRKKYAFISYSHKDERVAKWLQRKLESYRLPTGVDNECENTRYLRPIFRDRTDLNSGILSEEIRNNLDASKFLVVLCSSTSANSTWVNEEVSIFIASGRVENIIPVFIDNDQCGQLPESLSQYYIEHPEQELLAVDLHSEGKETAFIRIVSRMLSVEFNVLWDRHRRHKRRTVILSLLISFITLLAFYWFGVSVSLKVDIRDEVHNLPYPSEITLKVGDAVYELNSTTSEINISSLQGYMRLMSVPVHVEASYYKPFSSVIRLGLGVANEILISLSRDDSFSVFSGIVMDSDGNELEGVLVKVNSVCSVTDSTGRFHIELPLSLQAETQLISLSKDGYKEHIRTDECPGTNLGYILFRDE